MDNLLSKEVTYLIDNLNRMIQKYDVPQYVEVCSSSDINKQEVELEIKFEYLLHRENEKPVVIVTSQIAVDPELFYANEEIILKELNDKFFSEILLHTNFNTHISEKDYRDLLTNHRLN